jgi:hypothetical protein
VQNELQREYSTLMEKLRSMQVEDLMRPRPEEAPQKQRVSLWVLGDTTEHFVEHRATIEKAL